MHADLLQEGERVSQIGSSAMVGGNGDASVGVNATGILVSMNE